MIDAKRLLVVMKEGGSLEEAAAAQDVSIEELLKLGSEYSEIYTAIERGVTLCLAILNKQLRTQKISVEVYKILAPTVLQHLCYLQNYIKNGKK